MILYTPHYIIKCYFQSCHQLKVTEYHVLQFMVNRICHNQGQTYILFPSATKHTVCFWTIFNSLSSQKHSTVQSGDMSTIFISSVIKFRSAQEIRPIFRVYQTIVGFSIPNATVMYPGLFRFFLDCMHIRYLCNWYTTYKLSFYDNFCLFGIGLYDIFGFCMISSFK